MRWMVRAEVPIIGAVHAAFAVEKTEILRNVSSGHRLAPEMKNYLRYAAVFEERGQSP